MKEDDELEEIMEMLEETGALSWVGMDENGERLLQFDFNILREVMPDVYESMMKELDDELLHLYQIGLIEIEYDENLDYYFYISEKGKERLRREGFSLDD